MAPGANFTLIPNDVVILEPVYHTIITQAESMKKEYFNISATPEEKYRLFFNLLSDTEKDTLLTHFKDNSGGYYSFSWTSVPYCIEGGVAMTGRWVMGSLQITHVVPIYWNCWITFEKAV